MATKIRRCLYIGLGGTGMSALLHTKKMFVETYGEVPPMIGFLGIDTDGGAYKKDLDSKYGKITLSPNEQLPIKVQEARPIYEVNKDHFNWFPEENAFALTSMTLGAGQIRTNGRFALTVNYSDVENKVKSVIDHISEAKITNNPNYELLSANVEIHMVFSLCGGTGCGTFINMAYLLRKCAPECKLTGYGVLPDVFEAMTSSGMAKVKPNAYGAIQDLDWLMHMDLTSDKISLDYINSIQETNDRPFNAFFFIDNKNRNNDTYLHVDQLSEMISLTLVTSAGELSSSSASVSDNLEKNISAGSMDIENKRAWAASLGVCEIIFNGKDLRDLYANKAAKRLIERLLNSCIDADTIVNNWIDSPQVNIRENNGFDKVIDYMLEKEPRYPFSVINNKSNATSEYEAFLKSTQPKDGEIEAKIAQLNKRVSEELHKLMVKEINQECGVGAVESILLGIQAQVNIFLKEMKDELKDLKEKQPIIESSVTLAIKDLSDLNGKFFKSKQKLEEYCDSVIEAATIMAINQREIIRRNAAITFYNGLQNNLIDNYTKLANIKKMLIAIISSCTEQLSEIQNRVGRASQTFQIDLAQTFLNQVTIKDEEIQIEEFLKDLSYPEKIFEFDTKRSNEVSREILDYAKGLPTAKKWGNTTIDNILDLMDEDSFRHTINIAINKSEPLLKYNYKGYSPAEKPANTFYIGVPDKRNSRLYKNDYFKNLLQGSIDVDFSNIGFNDRVIIYRQFGVVPAYAIDPVTSYQEKYDNCNCNCHFDKIIFNKMLREDYNIMPKAAVDDTLDLWVKGFIFGLIKNENDNYYFKCDELGDSLDDYWVELSKYRDESFDTFKRNKTIIRNEFNEYFNLYQRNKGIDVMQAKVDDAKMNYFDKYSQINLTKDEIKTKGFETIRKLITAELEFVKKAL